MPPCLLLFLLHHLAFHLSAQTDGLKSWKSSRGFYRQREVRGVKLFLLVVSFAFNQTKTTVIHFKILFKKDLVKMGKQG